jgi:threonine dehydratase
MNRLPSAIFRVQQDIPASLTSRLLNVSGDAFPDCLSSHHPYSFHHSFFLPRWLWSILALNFHGNNILFIPLVLQKTFNPSIRHFHHLVRSNYMKHVTFSDRSTIPTEFYKYVIQTPLLLYSSPHTPWQGIYLKDETKQNTGAFKFRGNFHRLLGMSSMTDLVVTTASTGNHGVGLSTSARILGVQACIFVPATTPRVKFERLEKTGATIFTVDGDYDQCKHRSQTFAVETGAYYIPSFDDLTIITGHKSLFAEVEKQQDSDFDTVFVPVGGGGLLAACIEHYKGTSVKIVGVELDSAPAMARSLAQGQRTILEHAEGRAEGLLVREVGSIPFEIAQQAQNLEIFLVTEEQIRYAIRLLWERNNIRAEGAGAAATAAALLYPRANRSQKALAIVSGGNIDESYFQEALATALPKDLDR